MLPSGVTQLPNPGAKARLLVQPGPAHAVAGTKRQRQRMRTRLCCVALRTSMRAITRLRTSGFPRNFFSLLNITTSVVDHKTAASTLGCEGLRAGISRRWVLFSESFGGMPHPALQSWAGYRKECMHPRCVDSAIKSRAKVNMRQRRHDFLQTLAYRNVSSQERCLARQGSETVSTGSTVRVLVDGSTAKAVMWASWLLGL